MDSNMYILFGRLKYEPLKRSLDSVEPSCQIRMAQLCAAKQNAMEY